MYVFRSSIFSFFCLTVGFPICHVAGSGSLSLPVAYSEKDLVLLVLISFRMWYKFSWGNILCWSFVAHITPWISSWCCCASPWPWYFSSKAMTILSYSRLHFIWALDCKSRLFFPYWQHEHFWPSFLPCYFSSLLDSNTFCLRFLTISRSVEKVLRRLQSYRYHLKKERWKCTILTCTDRSQLNLAVNYFRFTLQMLIIANFVRNETIVGVILWVDKEMSRTSAKQVCVRNTNKVNPVFFR